MSVCWSLYVVCVCVLVFVCCVCVCWRLYVVCVWVCVGVCMLCVLVFVCCVCVLVFDLFDVGWRHHVVWESTSYSGEIAFYLNTGIYTYRPPYIMI